MSRQNFWRGITPLSAVSDSTATPERIVKLCSLGAEILALGLDHSLYYCDLYEDTLSFRRIPGVLALDLACDGNTLYLVDVHGRLFKSPATDVDARDEIVVREEARCCPHGFKTCSFKVKFRSVVASEFGCLFVSNDGQLWGLGVMPQIALDSPDVQKITFFEGRTVYSASLGSNFAAVISRRNVRRSGNYDTDSEEEEEVFASDCMQCRALAGPVSPASAPSPSETCPLGVQLSRSSEDSSSTTAAQSHLHPDAHSLTEDSSQSTEEPKVNKTAAAAIPPLILAETDPELNCEVQVDTCDGDIHTNSEKSNNIFMNSDAARQFLSRQLSWVSVGEDYLVEYTEKPTRIIKENVSNLTNLVYEGVKTVGDKVATLSRHVSGGSESCDPNDRRVPDPTDSLLYSCTSSYKLDELQFSTSTIASEKECDNISNDKSNDLVKLGRNILSTELWMWGDIEHGQLGIGDTMKRIKPMMVTSLTGFGLQKVCCGKLHTAALTLDGRMFSWGGNRYHQVSFESREDRSSPVQFTENSNMDRVRDIATAVDHTIVYTHDQNIYYMGKYPDEYTEKVLNLNQQDDKVEKNEETKNAVKQETEELVSNKKWQNKCYHWRISSAGNISYSYIEECSRSSVLPDLSIAQKILEEMLLIYHWLNKPFLKKSKAITVNTNVFESVCELYTDILNLTALNVLSMWQYAESHISECEISIIKNFEQYIYVYKKYLKAICNCICISGFSQIANVVDVPSSIYNLFSHQLPSSKQKNTKKTSEAIIALAFTQPLVRLSSYKCIVKSLLRYNAKKINTNSSTEKKLNDALSAWDALIDEHEQKKRDAEITKLFWETTGKVIDQFKTPDRRLIRESRSRPLSMVHAGRFSSHWFVLMNDIFLHISGSTQSAHPLETIWVEALANSDTSQNVIQMITPEETLNVSTSTSQEKTEWVHSLQTSIKIALNKPSHPKPPAMRTASYVFTNKNQFYKDAKYNGRWLDGKVHGHGRAEWPDGKLYVGQFQLNTFHGHGKMEIPNVGVYEGQWKDNLQNGYGVMKYTSGDLYEGHFKDGLANGHGVRRQGDFTTSTATIYLGEWSNGVKQGYGVIDDIGKGEKYLGSWSENKKHGCGLIVTLDGIYYEGVFMQDVLTGHGVMVFEDGTHYEGEFRSAGVFSGKGVLTFSSGDKIEGSLHGAWTEGVKISNATLQMNVSNPAPPENSKPNSFGKLCVAPHQKWNALFRQCYQSLGVPENLLTPTGGHFATGGSPCGNPVDNKKIWQNVAVLISTSHKATGRKSEILLKPFKPKNDLEDSVDCLEVIPQFGQRNLNLNSYMELKSYLQKACETSHHPLGQLVLGVTGAFNTTYGGVRVHPLLLSHAIKELKSITSRLYQLVRLLFPALPPDGMDLVLPHKSDGQEDNPIEGEVVSAASLLQPTLLPRVHPALFVLYALHNKREDDLYWRRLLKWNRQPDITLMAFLGIDQKFWIGYTTRDTDKSPTFSPLKEQLFNDAVETLQQVKTTFSPIEKLLVIRSTFQQMTVAVQRELGESYLWSMDELFPVFHFVVVRARILQLGSEIHFVEDFLEPCMQHGELGIMFTTLKACYFQILQEKVTITS